MKDEFMNKKIDAVMHTLDKVEKASPRPFLFTRLEARMQNEKNVWYKLSTFVARPMVAFACICFVLLINASVILFSDTKSILIQPGPELATADEYSQVSATIYEFENVKP
ncbi:MAG: hypothetical protein M3R50_00515 [Bacteroidota bacterium]|nr:hypothetical protein [Bacteroidota bacterium]